MNFVDKTDLLQTIDGIFESLLETAHEMENMRQKIERLQENQEELRRRVSHLKKIIINDMTVNPPHNYSKENALKTINMSKEEWNGYIESSISSSPLATVDLTPESSYTKKLKDTTQSNDYDLFT